MHICIRIYICIHICMLLLLDGTLGIVVTAIKIKQNKKDRDTAVFSCR